MALESMFAPVLHGAVSTLLGVIFSQFDFIIRSNLSPIGVPPSLSYTSSPPPPQSSPVPLVYLVTRGQDPLQPPQIKTLLKKGGQLCRL